MENVPQMGFPVRFAANQNLPDTCHSVSARMTILKLFSVFARILILTFDCPSTLMEHRTEKYVPAAGPPLHSEGLQKLRQCLAARIPVNVIMEQSPVAWPLPFSDSSRDDHERRVAAALALETVHDSDWFDSSDSDWTWFHHDQCALRTWFHSDHVDLMTVPKLEMYACLLVLQFLDFWSFGRHFP